MTGSSVRMPTDAPLTLVVPDYEVIENSAGFGRAHARYRLVITEAGSEWQVRRRWTSSRLTIDFVALTHPAAFTRDKVPDFEPHAWWRIGSSALDPKFLSERCASMQELLQALCDVLKVSIVRQDGPSALLALLMDCDTPDAPAEALMQRAHTTGGDLRADPPTPPADWRRAQSAAGALHSPERQQQRTSASPTRPREADGPNSREAEGSGQPAWLTEADRLSRRLLPAASPSWATSAVRRVTTQQPLRRRTRAPRRRSAHAAHLWPRRPPSCSQPWRRKCLRWQARADRLSARPRPLMPLLPTSLPTSPGRRLRRRRLRRWRRGQRRRRAHVRGSVSRSARGSGRRFVRRVLPSQRSGRQRPLVPLSARPRI